jgi:succinate-acetate transporter protein
MYPITYSAFISKVEVGEYGLHWNFFITLACLPPLLYLTTRLTNSPTHLFLISTLLLILYESSLQNGLSDIILNAPRTNLILANKEGLASLVGYFSIFLFAICVGGYTKTRSFFLPLFVLTIAFSVVYTFLEPSRRMVLD